ncbi:MAG: hypothetical protein L6Q71_07675, partial [Planctomycetes bacterium]|nr:hypothetical protein [Planctomycetota bacterium]
MTRIRTTLLAAGLCLASSSGLFADVAPKPRKTAPGPVLSTDMEDVEVQMKSEVVNLCLCKETKMHPEDDHASDYYSLEVEVTFEMVNHGEEVTFEEGFPCGPYQTMNNFSISVDGTKVDGVKLIDRA